MDPSVRFARPLTRKRVVIIGGGFGGLTVARALHDVDVLLIDRTNHHVFQPLLYHVATAALSPSEIAWPLRTLFRSQPNVRIVMDEVLSIDRISHVVRLRHSAPIRFDVLVVAPGSHPAYRGHQEWTTFAPGLKTLADAAHIRSRVLLALEAAERQRVDTGSHHSLPFVIVGGGPTGVELAGALLEIGIQALGPDYPHLRREDLSIVLVEAGSRILSEFDPKLSAKALASLERMGVTVKLNKPVTAIRADGVRVGDEWIASTNVIWAAGNTAAPLLTTLGVAQDSSGRITVQPDLTIPGSPWIFVIGDAAHCLDSEGLPLPGIAPVAMSQGRYVADVIDQDLAPEHRTPFTYRDHGMVATIGRTQAIAQLGPLCTSGRVPWVLWYVTHLFCLIGLRTPLSVMSKWIWSFLTVRPGAHLLGDDAVGRPTTPVDAHADTPAGDASPPVRRAA